MKKLLLVEDDRQLSAMYLQKFQREGWDAFVCHDGQEAVQLALEKDYNVIVLDLGLPGLSGLEVLEILRSNKKTAKIPIVVYTNFGDKYNREKCLAYGADEFILKVDSTPESLIKTVDRVTGG